MTGPDDGPVYIAGEDVGAQVEDHDVPEHEDVEGIIEYLLEAGADLPQPNADDL